MTVPAANDLALLLIPTLRWRAGTGFAHEEPRIEEALALGVGGFRLVGGEQEAVRTLAKRLQQKSRHPLLVAAEMERGAGQQFEGATGLPPAAAIVSLGDEEALRRAARLTAREARTMGVNWNLAPVCDLDVLEDHPTLGTRAFGREPRTVGKLVAAWIEACQAEGVLACARHFPGIGRSPVDQREALPVVDAHLDVVKEQDLAPFRAAIGVGVASIMAAHVSVPALDMTKIAATLSREIMQWLLRQQLKYDNLVVADALDLPALQGGHTPEESAVLAVRAGCDVLLAPDEVAPLVDALQRAREAGQLDPERLRTALRRRLKWAQWASPPNDWRRPSGADTAWGGLLAERCLVVEHGPLPPLAGLTEVCVVDDDAPLAPVAPHAIFADTLRTAGLDAREHETPTPLSHGPLLIVLFGDRRPGKGRAWYAPETIARVRELVAAAEERQRVPVVVAFGDPRMVRALDLACPVVIAWSGDAVMQRAAARLLAKKR